MMTQLGVAESGLDAILEYISHLHVEEIEDLQSRRTLEQTSLSDEDLAMLIFAEEAEALLNITRDRVAGQSSSQTLLSELIAMEEMARFDHEMALALAEGLPLPVLPEPPRRPVHSGGPVPVTLIDHYDAESSSGSSSSAASESDISDVESESELEVSEEHYERSACTVCGESIIGPVVYASCGHPYDVNCVQVLFQKATTDESLFPPRCCQVPIPLPNVQDHLDLRLFRLFQKKSVEFSTPNRVYCSKKTCSAFLGAATVESSSLPCADCASRTCGACKAEAHVGRSCSAHTDHVVLGMAKQEGWQRCYSCKHLVELNHGCFHITCLCKAQFCYLCAEPWKQCSCPQFDEARL